MHTHAHGEVHSHAEGSRRLVWATRIVLLVCGVEIFGGVISHSVALFSDAFHMLADASALYISLIAARIALKPPTVKQTYGYRRIDTIAALVNGVLLGGTIFLVATSAFKRLFLPVAVESNVMTLVGIVGLVANLVCLLLLKGHQHHSQNFRSAFLHVLGDTLSSVAVVICGWAITVTGISSLDSITSLGISGFMLWNVFKLIRDSAMVLLDSVPDSINLTTLHQELEALPGVANVHDLHVSGTPSDGIVCTLHFMPKQDAANLEAVAAIIAEIKRRLLKGYCIAHVAIQPDIANGTCDCSFVSSSARV